ncbi:MAG: hypothetical protein WAU88_00060 [Candidatus Zixiibacteriota bacterium]
MIARVIVCIAILATSGYGQIPKDRLMAFISNQSTRVYYWGVALDKPPDSYQENRQFIPVQVHHIGGSDADSILLMTTGLQAGDSVFFYFVPTVNESGATLTRATGDTIHYRATSAPPATTSEIARETRKVLDSLSSVLPNYNRLAVKVKNFNSTLDFALAGVGCFVGAVLLVKYKGGLNQAVGITSAATGVFFLVHGLVRHDRQEQRVEALSQLEKQFPPGF